MQNDLKKRIENTINFIKSKTDIIPEAGIILGSGLGNLTSQMDVKFSFNYEDIPDFPVATVLGHGGKLSIGYMNGKAVALMQGRFHYYEGYSMKEVTFPVRVLKFLGVKTLFITNASGGLNPKIKVGELMIVNDHINLQPEHPLRGKNDESMGPRFPDQHAAYDKELISQALQIAEKNKIKCHTGVYVGVQGPTFETPAEYRYMHIIGGDAVGMSTVPEVIVARHMGMIVFAISVICDEGNPEVAVKVTHDDVIKAAAEAEPRMALIIRELIAGL